MTQPLSTFSSFSPLSDAIDLNQIRRVLIIKLRHHGDVLLTSPVLSTLKAHAPHCEIDALIFADTAPMLAQHPALNQLHTIDRNWKKNGPLAQIAPEWTLFKALRSREYDLIVHLTDHPRGAWLARLLGARWAVAPIRRNKKARWWKKTFTHLYRYPGGGTRHTVECNLDALRRLGIQPSEEQKRLVLVSGDAADQRVQTLLSAHSLQSKGFIHFHPTSRWFFKTWPIAQNVQLLEALFARGERIVITAAPDAREQEMVQDILQQLTDIDPTQLINLAGQLSLKELSALTAQAKIFVGVDSAPMHIAAAVATPVVALFGPSGDKEWGPWKVPHEVVASLHTCRPCGQDGCGGGKISECLTSIPAQRVLHAMDGILALPAA